MPFPFRFPLSLTRRVPTAGRPLRSAPPILLVLALVSLPLGCGPAPEPASEASAPAGAEDGDRGAPPSDPGVLAEEIQEWQAERESSLLRPEGWLSLVALCWLDEGANPFGGAADNALVLPPSPGGEPPDRAGTFFLEDGAARLEAAPGAEIRVAREGEDGVGPRVTETVLVPDTEEGTTRLALGSFRFWVIERGGRLGVRVLDRRSPARESFEGLDYFPIDPDWRIEARLERREGLTVAVPNVLGQVSREPAPGELVFEAPTDPGRELRLLPMAAGDELFIVFGDATNGESTYGGGRFLYADAPAEGETRVILDFNRAYNPPCAFTAYATCPLPPPENKLPVAIPAGEKAYGGGHPDHPPLNAGRPATG